MVSIDKRVNKAPGAFSFISKKAIWRVRYLAKTFFLNISAKVTPRVVYFQAMRKFDNPLQAAKTKKSNPYLRPSSSTTSISDEFKAFIDLAIMKPKRGCIAPQQAAPKVAKIKEHLWSLNSWKSLPLLTLTSSAETATLVVGALWIESCIELECCIELFLFFSDLSKLVSFDSSSSWASWDLTRPA